MPPADLAQLDRLLGNNEKTVSLYYRLSVALLITVLLTHVTFASYYIYPGTAAAISSAQVQLFAVFNVTALIVDLYLGRIAFMLASRVGQLRDMRYALILTNSQIDGPRFAQVVKALMSMRRDTAGLKVVDIEAIAAKLPQGKGS